MAKLPQLSEMQQFQLLVDAVADYALFMLDEDGFVVSWNSGAQRIKGYKAEDIVGHHFSHFFTSEDLANGVPAEILARVRSTGHHESEGWRVRKDGSRFWANAILRAVRDEAGNLIGFAKITRDITERRAAQEALRESERQFRLLVKGVTDYALYMLDPNGNITSWNAGAEKIKGYTGEEIIGQHFSRFYTEADRAAGVPASALSTAARDGRFEREGWRVRKDGTLFWANVVIDAIRDERGDLIGFAKITRDITERREAQIALQEAQARSAHAQKMDALGQLTGGVAHDFNNLLMVVLGNIQTIKKAVADNPKVARAAGAVELAARRGETLTRQLLTFSRRQTFMPTVFALGERIEALRNMLASSLSATVELATSVDPQVWPVKADASELELALVNVTLNARDAMPEGGVVTITAENVTLSGRDTPSAVEGNFVALRVSDAGSGIAPDVLPKVFDPFFTTKDVAKGSGLGLSQVHGFAHQSGGTVTIASELGKGTTVTIYLPRGDKSAAESLEAVPMESGGSGQVLVVEDNPDVSDVAVRMLRQLGYDVSAASDAASALALLETQHFDLVVSDIVMGGGMDGLALAKVIRERKPRLPVLLMTGYSRAASTTADFPVLRKPFDLADIGRSAARMIAEAKQPTSSNLLRMRDAPGPQ